MHRLIHVVTSGLLYMYNIVPLIIIAISECVKNDNNVIAVVMIVVPRRLIFPAYCSRHELGR